MARSTKVKEEVVVNENSVLVVKQDPPDKLSPEWHDYVMGQFSEEEMIDGNPTVAGLRRLAEKFVGEIVSSKPTKVYPVERDGLGRATVEYEVCFAPMDGVSKWKHFGDVADVWVGNADEIFVAFAVSVAATRAEARCLRKALKLRAVAAEEVASKVITPKEDRQNDDVITDNQIGFIDKRCKELDINVHGFMNAGENQYRSLNQVLKSTASKMIQELNRLFNSRDDIPSELKGYREDWQSNFRGSNA